MVQRMSDQHKIKFLDNEEPSETTDKEKKVESKTISQVSEEQKAKKLVGKDDGLMTSNHISSARTGQITDNNGPSKYIKSESSNTIWKNKTTKEVDSKTKTIQDKEQISSNKRQAEQNRMENLVNSLKSTDLSKASAVSPAGNFKGTNYKISNNDMSMFDKKDFQRLEEKTGGEKVSEEVKEAKNQIDESWRNGGKSISSKETTKRFFDNIFNKEE